MTMHDNGRTLRMLEVQYHFEVFVHRSSRRFGDDGDFLAFRTTFERVTQAEQSSRDHGTRRGTPESIDRTLP